MLSGAYLSSVDISGTALDGADFGDAVATTELEASAKDKISLKMPELPNADAKYANLHRSDKVRSPLRTFGGPLRLPCDLKYTRDEFTVKYLQRARSVLVGRLIIPTLIFLGLIISLFYFPPLYVYILTAILVMLFAFAYIIINYWDDIYILTNKRIIDIERKFLFFNKEHISAEYGNIRDVKVIKPDSVIRALDVGWIIVQMPDDDPYIVMELVDHPFAIRDMIFRIKNHIEKNEKRN
ncbi:MAG: hypothetical protein ACXVDN_18375 [Ktedonobacteraceae bacterium]